MRFGKYTTALLAALGALCAAPPAFAQITGKMINPDVLLVLDTSRSMDWLKDSKDTEGEDMSATERDRAARKACLDANEVTGTSKRTSWQQLTEVMLGGIAPADFHCFLENPPMRPALQSGTVATVADIAKNTGEYTTGQAHKRAVSCKDPRTGGDRGEWNTSTGQCVGAIPDPSDYRKVDDNLYCLEEDIYSFTDTDGANTQERCYDYNPRAKSRSSNGILERYRTLARFGVMTYDNRPAPLSDTDAHNGWFDYGDTRKWNCKRWGGHEEKEGAGCRWNAGARAPNANAVGRLVSISDDMEASNQAVRDVLDTTEPLFCSPVGALLDDVGYYFNSTSNVRPAMSGGGGSDLYFSCRPRLVIFIGDGAPNSAFEFPHDYCTGQGADYPAPAAPDETDSDSEVINACPWNSSKDEVTEMREVLERMATSAFGGVENMAVDPIYFVVIGFNAGDKGEVECSTPTWEVSTTSCIPSDSRCVQIATADTMADCTADKFRTPRQFLNELALAGWPAEGSTDISYSYKLQPPWRDGTSNLCKDESDGGVDNSCGGEESDGDDPEDWGAIFVDGPDELSAVLDLILSAVTATTATRTEVVTTNQVGLDYGDEWSEYTADDDQVSQYEFNSGFEVRGGQPWRGYLYRNGYGCSDSESEDAGGAIGTPAPFHTWLDKQSIRKIYSISQGTLGDLSYATTDHFIKGFDALQEIGTLDGSYPIDDCAIGGPTDGTAPGICSGQSTILAALKTHLYGETGSARENHRLADIYNSTPAVLGPPLERINLASYQTFQGTDYARIGNDTGGTVSNSRQMGRPPLLFQGTNDGVLHAFDIWSQGSETDLTSKEVENWGFVPNALLGDITKQFPIGWTVQYDAAGTHATGYTLSSSGLYQHTFGVDGSPVAADVRLFRTNAADSADNWRSIVIGGLGKGGVGYYALDVTERQAKPNFRWEISESFPANNDASVWKDASGDFLLGMALGKPTLTYAYVEGTLPGLSGTPQKHEVAVAILPGGYKSDETGGIGVSTGVAIVRAADGKLLQYLSPTEEDTLCAGTKALYPDPSADTDGAKADEIDHYLTAQLIGEPAVPYPLRSLTVNDEAFIGDDRGRLWRIDMASTNPDNWCLDLFFDSLLTTDFPYQDCVGDCDDKTVEGYATDDEFGIDDCTGQPCANPSYPFPRIPILNAPTIVQDENRNNIILFGTGQLDGVEALDHHRVFSLKQSIDYKVAADTDGTSVASAKANAPTINWWLGEPVPTTLGTVPSYLTDKHTALIEAAFDPADVSPPASTQFEKSSLFNEGEKLLGRIAVFNEVAYFTTFIPVNQSTASGAKDACESGASRIWGVRFDSLPSTSTTWTSGNFGKLTVKGSGETVMFIEEANSLLTGLKLVRRPSCSGQAEFQLVAQKANPAATGVGSSPSDTTQRIQSVAVTIQQPTRGFTTVAIDSWSLVFD